MQRNDSDSSSVYRTFAVKVVLALLISAVAFFLICVIRAAAKMLLIIFAGVLAATFLRSMSTPLSRKTRLPHWVSVIVVILIFSAFFYLVFDYLSPHVAAQSQELARRLPDAVQRLYQQVQNTNLGSMALSHIPNLEDLIKSRSVLKEVKDVFSITLGFVSDLFIFLFIALYFTFEPGSYIRGLIHLVPVPKRRRISEVITAVTVALRRWILGRLVSMAAVGVITGIGLWLLDVPLALTLGLLGGFLTFIPYIGAVISSIPAVLLALLAEPVLAVYVVGLYLLAHGVEAYILTPIVQQHQVNLPPVFTLVSQILMSYAAGLPGLMLATPLAAVIVVIIKMLYVEDALGEKATAPPGA